MTEANTLFLRLEGPLQSWGDTSKFVIRRTMDAPTKSGVLGLICCALGLSRKEAQNRLHELNELAMGVRIDRKGTRWWDYHTVGARIGMTTADHKLKTGAQGTLVTRREYLADASFLVAIQGGPGLINEIYEALMLPKWPFYLGRKSCPPSVQVLARPAGDEPWSNPARHDSLVDALQAVPWRPRYQHETKPKNNEVEVLVEWQPASESDTAPEDAEVWYDVPISFDPPFHEPRFVLRHLLKVDVGEPTQRYAQRPPRPRADYKNGEYRKRREERIESDNGLCTFCKLPGPRLTVQHVTYRRAGGDETLDDLRTLCGLCHDAVTMLEYGLGMGIDRINPEDPRWRDLIIQKRDEILKFRSLKTRRRRLPGSDEEE